MTNLLLKVTFPNGTVICRPKSVDTMWEVFKTIGPEYFPRIGKSLLRNPILTKEIPARLKKYALEVEDGWYYINYNSDIYNKMYQLQFVSDTLGLWLDIDCGFDFETTKPTFAKNRNRIRRKLIVTMPDGEVLDYESHKDVFAACIDKLGAWKVRAKANLELSSNSLLFTPTNHSHSRLKMDENIYLHIPQTVKEAYTILIVINKRLNVNIKISLEDIKSSNSFPELTKQSLFNHI